MLGEWLGCKPAFVPLPDHRWIQTFLDGGPDGKVGSKLVAIDGNVRSIANAHLLDLVKQIVLGIACEDIRHTRLNPHPHQGKLIFLLPIAGFPKLIVAELDAGLMERILSVWLREG